MTRLVQYPSGMTFADLPDLQVNYLNYHNGWLIPDTEIWIGDARLLRINDLGCLGENLKSEVPVIGYFGDSTTFGTAGFGSWVDHVFVSGYQQLNAGVEGHNFPRIIERFATLSKHVDFAAIVVCGTWHNLVYNDVGPANWKKYFDKFQGEIPIAFCTLAMGMTEDIRTQGIAPLIERSRTSPLRFLPWGNWPTTVEKTVEVYEAVLAYNEFVREYCENNNRILIDFYTGYRPSTYDEIPELFLDPPHYRPTGYPKLGEIVTRALAPNLSNRATTTLPQAMASTSGGDKCAPPTAIEYDHNKNVYPLW